MLLPPAWWRANGPDVGIYGVFMFADLRAGTTRRPRRLVPTGSGTRVLRPPGRGGRPDRGEPSVDRQIGAEGRARRLRAGGRPRGDAPVGWRCRQLAAEGRTADLLALGGVVLRARGGHLLRSWRSPSAPSRSPSPCRSGSPLAAGRCGDGQSARGMDVDGLSWWWGRAGPPRVVAWSFWSVGGRLGRRPERRPPSRSVARPAPPSRDHRRAPGPRAIGRGGRPRRHRGRGLAMAVVVAAVGLITSLHDCEPHPCASGRSGTPPPATSRPTKGRARARSSRRWTGSTRSPASSADGEIGGRRRPRRLRAVPRRARPEPREGRPLRPRRDRARGQAGRRARCRGRRSAARAWDALDGAPEEVPSGIGAVAGMGFDTDPGTFAPVTRRRPPRPGHSVSVLLVRFAPTPTARRCWRSSASSSRRRSSPRRSRPGPCRRSTGCGCSRWPWRSR